MQQSHVEAIDENHARAMAVFEAKKMAARLSFLLHLDLYEPRVEHKWVLSEDFNSPSKICQTGYHGFLESCSSMPKKGSVCKLGSYSANIYSAIRYLGEPVAFPDSARAIFKGLKLLPKNYLNAFDAMCRMYQIAMQMKNFPTIRISYLVSAVESIAKNVEDAPLNSFSGFVIGYAKPGSDVKELLNYLYSTVRSAHFHAGGFPFGEHGINEEFFIFKEMGGQRNGTDFRRGVDLIRYALVNWVIASVNAVSQTIAGGHEGALLHKSAAGRTTPIPRRTYPMRTVCGVPSAVKRFKIAAQI